MEFVRRFSLHVLPKAFVRIRHYGILSSTCKTKSIAEITKQLPAVKQTDKKASNNTLRPIAMPLLYERNHGRIT